MRLGSNGIIRRKGEKEKKKKKKKKSHYNILKSFYSILLRVILNYLKKLCIVVQYNGILYFLFINQTNFQIFSFIKPLILVTLT